MKFVGFRVAWYGWIRGGSVVYGVVGKEGYTSLKACLLSRWGGSVWLRFRVMGWFRGLVCGRGFCVGCALRSRG
jgi:hypothetical protein